MLGSSGTLHCSPGKSRGLSSWLEALASEQTVEEREDFLEPNLRFEVAARDEDTITILVYFELESRPP